MTSTPNDEDLHPSTRAWRDNMIDAGYEPSPEAIENYEQFIQDKKKEWGLEPNFDPVKDPPPP